ncbi:Protein of unknown function [Leuconostoc citreum LBAE E16]|nr:Protein of unknown function [Leuconostoc citreum LBAE E16]
MASKSAEK